MFTFVTVNLFTFVTVNIKRLHIMQEHEFCVFEERKLFGRYITNTDIYPLLNNLPKQLFRVSEIGQSVLGESIHKVVVGSGSVKILLWSQMHGNESTTTKALFDLFNMFKSGNEWSKQILTRCTLQVIPILNPDGARAYTRLNANLVDLNRDAVSLSQPESKLLREVFDEFKPNYCFNLHGQRTIFGVGNTNISATASFLAPAQSEDRAITATRKVAMAVIAHINKYIQEDIPKGVGLYDDAFNINCVGDMFQSKNVPTILFEAGHFPNDYNREYVRFLMLKSLYYSLSYISKNNIDENLYNSYMDIPENKKTFFDIIVKNVKVQSESSYIDVAFQYKEILEGNTINFIPYAVKFGDLNQFFGHKVIDGEERRLLSVDNSEIIEENSYDEIMLDNDKLSLKLH